MENRGLPMEGRGRARGRARAIASQPTAVVEVQDQPKVVQVPCLPATDNSDNAPSTMKNLEQAHHDAQMVLEAVAKEIAVRARAAKKVDNENEDGHRDKSIAAVPLKELPVNEASAAEEKLTPLILPSSDGAEEKVAAPLTVPSSGVAAEEKVTPLILPSSDGAEKLSTIQSENCWKRQAEEQQKVIMEQRKRIQELQENIENLQTSSKITSALVANFENRCRDALSGTFNLIMNDFKSTLSVISDLEGFKGLEHPTLANMLMEAPPPAPVVSSKPIALLPTAQLSSNPSGVRNKKPPPPAPALLDAIKMLTPDDLAELKNIDFDDDE